MIKSFKDAVTRAAFEGEVRKGFPADLLNVARRKLQYLHAAAALQDLRSPPGNRLEALKGNRRDQHSIRVTISSASVSSGQKKARWTSNSPITTPSYEVA